MPELSATVDFEVYCGTCGAPMCHKSSVCRGNQVHVDACEKCMEDAKADGDDEGYKRGYEEARKAYEVIG